MTIDENFMYLRNIFVDEQTNMFVHGETEIYKTAFIMCDSGITPEEIIKDGFEFDFKHIENSSDEAIHMIAGYMKGLEFQGLIEILQ